MLSKLMIMVSTAVLTVAIGIAADFDTGGTIEGMVTLDTNGKPLHKAEVLIVELGRVMVTDKDGRFVFPDVPAGTYALVSYMPPLSASSKSVEVRDGEVGAIEFQLSLSPIKQEITVTAKGRHETAFTSVHSVKSLDKLEMAEKMAPSIGEMLDGELGVAKRSFGPGSARPVLRGFDGDRVLVMQDGVRSGSLASQSGDHGEAIDASNLEHIEIIKGPATLLYGSNAIGGVVNAISKHQELHESQHPGFQGQVSSVFGSNNGHAGASVTADYVAEKWSVWGGGGGQRTGDYTTPLGKVDNSKSRISNASAGFGYFGQKGYATLSYGFNDGRHGVPFATEFHGHHDEEAEADHDEEEELEAVDIGFRDHRVRFGTGLRNLDTFVEGFNITLSYNNWSHDELEILEDGDEVIGTSFDNKQFVYRGVFNQAKRGIFSGTFGLWGMVRDYSATGEEALSPPVDQNAFAVFALEELTLERVTVQLGGRVEYTAYTPKGLVERGHHDEEEPELVALPKRDFTGFSGGIGGRFDLWDGGAFVANYATSFRAPALEELYNFGPHVGNLAFEVGDPNLKRERSNGIDMSLRHQSDRVSGEVSLFLYDLDDFVYLAPTGEIEDGLIEAEFLQRDSRFTGAEFRFDAGLNQYIWLNLGLDTVRAELSDTKESLPRIPPLRGRVGVDFRYRGLSVKPEVVMADSREDIFSTETATAGYTVVNLLASYSIPMNEYVHHFSFQIFNVGDRLYRNHVSFIKDFAPEIGRGVKFTYNLMFF